MRIRCAQFSGESSEFCYRSRTHLFHHLRAVGLDGALGDVEFAGDLLIKPSRYDVLEYRSLASCKRVEALFQVEAPLRRGPPFLAVRQGRMHRRQQRDTVDGLGQKVDRPTFHGLDDRPDITVTRHEHYREGALALETSLKLQPRQARQPIVEHEARRAGGGALREERLRRVERPHGKTERVQMARQRCSRPFVVLDDEDISQ